MRAPSIHMKRFWSLFWCLWGLLLSDSCLPNSLNVLTAAHSSAQPVIDWCLLPASASIETASGTDCHWQPLAGEKTSRGFDRRAFWLRFSLANPGPAAVERWISVGYPRLTEISLYSQGANGWVRQDVGITTPLRDRGEVEREWGVLPVTVAAYSTRTVWLRVASHSAIELSTTVWRPANYMHHHKSSLFWAVMAIGGVFVTVLFSLLMFFMTRQRAYVFFAIALTGALSNVSLTTGILQRFLWPIDLGVPPEVIPVGTLVFVLGYYAFMRNFLPNRSSHRSVDFCFKASVLLTVLALIYAVMIDYMAARVWSVSLVLTVMFATLISFLSWREGDKNAGTLLAALLIYLILSVLRFLVSTGQLSWFPEMANIGPWSMLLTMPVILLGLVDRTRQLVLDLSQARMENMTKVSFLAQMSHELRSPLDSILGNSQLLARSGQNAVSAERLSNIFDSGRQLLRMIDHILDYSRGLAGVIRFLPEPILLEPFLRGTERSARLLAAQNNNRFFFRRSPDSPDVEGLVLHMDADPLRRVLDNLISNACRHTLHGSITLDLKITSMPGDQVRLDFAVSDTGEGIASENLERIFYPFVRIQATGIRHSEGAGLGLCIARQLVELMGGHLSVESDPGQGACFRFSIVAKVVNSPVKIAPESPDGLEAVSYLGPKRTVLVVDDNMKHRTLLTELLEDLGFRVIESDSGRAASNLIKTLTELDLVITDQFMDGGDGWMLLKLVFSERPGLPIFLVSGSPPTPPPDWPSHYRFTAQFLRPLNHGLLLKQMGDLLDLTWTAAGTAETREDSLEQLEGAQSSDVHAVAHVDTLLDRVSLNERELRDLRDLVENGQVTEIKHWALSLKQRSPEHSLFSDRILLAVNALDMETLSALVAENGE